jgi:septal ring factor EnvC (AmiA/AmiB activator)
VGDLLGYLTGRELSAQEEGIVAPLCRAWVCSLNPAFLKGAPAEANVSITPIPLEDVGSITALLDTLAANAATIAEQKGAIEDLEGQVAELTPFQGKTADLTKKVESLEAKIATLEGEKKELAKANAEFSGKLAVDESELTSTVKDIVEKAVKAAVASLPVGVPGAAPAEGGEVAAEAAPAEETGGVPDTFGFGASGSDGDGFGF